MILKEAYRYQNHLTDYLRRIADYLRRECNVMLITEEHLRSKAHSDALDETTDNLADRMMDVKADTIVDFGVAVLDEKQKLCKAIDNAKFEHCRNVDSDIAMNKSRQLFIATLNGMAACKNRERTTSGIAYCFTGNRLSIINCRDMPLSIAIKTSQFHRMVVEIIISNNGQIIFHGNSSISSDIGTWFGQTMTNTISIAHQIAAFRYAIDINGIK